MLQETIKLLKEKPDPVLLGQILKRLSSRSAVSINIHQRPVTIKLVKVLLSLGVESGPPRTC